MEFKRRNVLLEFINPNRMKRKIIKNPWNMCYLTYEKNTVLFKYCIRFDGLIFFEKNGYLIKFRPYGIENQKTIIEESSHIFSSNNFKYHFLNLNKKHEKRN